MSNWRTASKISLDMEGEIQSILAVQYSWVLQRRGSQEHNKLILFFEEVSLNIDYKTDVSSSDLRGILLNSVSLLNLVLQREK